MCMKSMYSPREFGALIGRTTKTLQRWDREGILKAFRSALDRRYYTHDQYLEFTRQYKGPKKRVVYCRVSSHGQKNDLLAQKQAVESFCLASGKTMDEKMDDIGSGLNYQRKNFLLLMERVERG